MYVYFQELSQSTYALPVLDESGLPRLPSGGIARIEDLKNAKSAAVIPSGLPAAVNPSVYAYTRQNTRRNLYRIQLP